MERVLDLSHKWCPCLAGWWISTCECCYPLKWSSDETSNQVNGAVELYVRDSTGNPIMRQRLVSSPPSPSFLVTAAATLTQNRQSSLQQTLQMELSRWHGGVTWSISPPRPYSQRKSPMEIQTLRDDAQNAPLTSIRGLLQTQDSPVELLCWWTANLFIHHIYL